MPNQLEPTKPKLEVISSPVMDAFAMLLICIAQDKGVTVQELIKESKNNNQYV